MLKAPVPIDLRVRQRDLSTFVKLAITIKGTLVMNLDFQKLIRYIS